LYFDKNDYIALFYFDQTGKINIIPNYS